MCTTGTHINIRAHPEENESSDELALFFAALGLLVSLITFLTAVTSWPLSVSPHEQRLDTFTSQLLVLEIRTEGETQRERCCVHVASLALRMH